MRLSLIGGIVLSTALSMALTSHFASADTEFEDSVPLDLVKALLGTAAQTEPAIYSDIFDEFPPFTVPDEFTVLGSADQFFNKTVVLETELEEEPAIAALTSSFVASGFTDFEVPEMAERESGFIFVNFVSRINYQRLCHDDHGFLTLSYRAQANGNLVNIANPRQRQLLNCARQLEEQRNSMTMYRQRNQIGLQQYMPRLEMPRDAEQDRGPFLRGGGFSGSNRSLETDAVLENDMAIEEVFNHFKQQIEAQGWSLDSENIGNSSANGVWTSAPEPDMGLVGSLTVIETEESQYDLRFQVTNTSARQGGFFPGAPTQIRN